MFDKIDKNTPFKVPENYFENFHTEIMAEIDKVKQPKVIPMWKKVIPWSAAAAVIGGMILSVNIFSSDPIPFLSSKADTENSDYREEMYASTDEEYFYLFLEDETTKDAYYEAIY